MSVHLTPNEHTVLGYLVEEGFVESWDGGFVSFAPIIADTKLDRATVRRACRSLKRKGLTTFCSGLWNDEGEPAGSGYAATKAAAAMIETPFTIRDDRIVFDNDESRAGRSR